jgi:hypothetical protein
VTGDEDDSSSGNRVLTVVIAAGLSHRVMRTPLRFARTARAVGAAFALPVHR